MATVREVINRSTKILERYLALGNDLKDKMSFYIDLEKSNINLVGLLKESDVDFLHDIYGMNCYFNRQTLKWDCNFIPRCGFV